MICNNSLEKRLIALFVISMVFMLVLQGMATHWFMNKEIHQWEMDELEFNQAITINLIRNRFDGLELTANDYAIWDETYDFVEQYSTQESSVQYLTPDDLSIANLVGIQIEDQASNIISFSSIDENLGNELQKGFQASTVKGEDKGVVLLNNRIFIYVKVAICSDLTKEYSNGFLTLFREFTHSDALDIVSDVGTMFSLDLIDANSEPVRYSMTSFATPELLSVNIDDDYLTGVYQFELADGRYLPINIELLLDRDIQKLFHMEVLIFFQVIGILGITSFMWYQLRKSAVKPIVNMANSLEKQGNSNEAYEPLGIKCKNEIGLLAQNINTLFVKVSLQHKFNQLLLDTNEDIILTVSEDWSITYANPAAERWFNKRKGEINGSSMHFALTDVSHNKQSIMYLLHNVFDTKANFTAQIDLRNNYTNQITRNAQVTGYFMKNEQVSKAGILVIIRPGEVLSNHKGCEALN